MARAFNNFCQRVLSAARDGMAARTVAARVGSGASTAIGWIANGRQGQMTPVNHGRPSGCGLETAADNRYDDCCANGHQAQ